MFHNKGHKEEIINTVQVKGGVFSMDWISTGLTPDTTPNNSTNNTPVNSPQKTKEVATTYQSISSSKPIACKPNKKLTFYDYIPSPALENKQGAEFLAQPINIETITNTEKSKKTNKISPLF